jgi:hypothetical protein
MKVAFINEVEILLPPVNVMRGNGGPSIRFIQPVASKFRELQWLDATLMGCSVWARRGYKAAACERRRPRVQDQRRSDAAALMGYRRWARGLSKATTIA